MKNKNFLLAPFLVLGLFILVGTAGAVGVDSPLFESVGGIFGAGAGPAGQRTLGTLITQIVSILLVVAASIAVIFLMVGGYRYVVARGNEEGIEEAKKTISGSIIGLIVIILSFAIIRIIASALLQGTTGLGI